MPDSNLTPEESAKGTVVVDLGHGFARIIHRKASSYTDVEICTPPWSDSDTGFYEPPQGIRVSLNEEGRKALIEALTR